MIGERGDCWAKGITVVGRADAIGAVQKIDGVHSIDANEQNAFDMVAVVIMIGESGARANN